MLRFTCSGYSLLGKNEGYIAFKKCVRKIRISSNILLLNPTQILRLRGVYLELRV